MIAPRRLRSGDRVAVVAPASPCPPGALEAGVAEIERLGFQAVVDPSATVGGGYEAGPAEARAAAIARALADDSIRAVMASRGGYGSVLVLPRLDAAAVRLARKAFVGYSDITSLLTFVTGACGLVAFHGPTVAGGLDRGADGYDRSSLWGLLARAEPLGELAPPGVEVFHAGEAAGRLAGGNMALLAASLGTPFAFDPPPGCVLWLEDVNERPYRLDRLWTQLALAGIIARASAVVFGEFPGCDEPDGGPTARETLAALSREAAGPVLFGFPSGHTAGPALTLPLGVRARVVAGARPAVVIEEAAVAEEQS
jgi:muramoyltetrapeptide carboxypeptidase